jgi:hypothetical protein
VHNVTGVAQAAQSTASGSTQTQAAAQELARLAAELENSLNQFKYDDGGQEPKALAKVKETTRKALTVNLQPSYRPATSSLETR